MTDRDNHSCAWYSVVITISISIHRINACCSYEVGIAATRIRDLSNTQERNSAII